MAKQTGIHGLKGKVNGMSYYSSKNGGSLVRKINEGLGQRVKSSREYLNTRKNNAEFGMCGDFAGAIIKPISQRWRFILDSIATGKMVKVMKDAIRLNTLNPWGQRVLAATDYPALIDAFNSFSKNPMLEEIASILSNQVTWNPEGDEVVLTGNVELSSERQHELLAEGINHINVKAYALQVDKPTYSALAEAYTKANSSLVEIPAFSSSFDINGAEAIDIFDTTTAEVDFSSVVTSGDFGGLLFVFLPGRKIGNVVSVLQEKCSAMLAPVVAAE